MARAQQCGLGAPGLSSLSQAFLTQQEQLIAKQELEGKQPAGPSTAPGGKECKAIVL